MNIEPKLQAIEKEFLDIEERMGDPATASDPRALQDLGKKRAQLEPVVEKYRQHRGGQGPPEGRRPGDRGAGQGGAERA